MPEYLAPGVYVEEIERGPKPIDGVATSIAAFLGETERGPTRPRMVTSYGEFLRLFGDVFGEGRYVPYAANAFFDNGGRRLYIARVIGAVDGEGGGFATRDMGEFRVRSIGPGAAYDRVWARIDGGTTLDKARKPIGFRLRLAYWDRDPPEGVALFDPFEPANDKEFPRPTMIEDFDDVSLDAASPSHWDKRINNGNSSLVTIDIGDGARLDALPGDPGLLDGAADGGTPGAVHYLGNADDPDARTGLAALALDPYRDVAIVAAPGQADPAVLREARSRI